MERRTLLRAAVLTFGAIAFCGLAQPERGEAGGIAAALEAARGPEPPGYRLVVHRTDREGQRRLEVYPSGVGIWNRTAQITLSEEVRASLLGIIRERGFAAMAPSYGGQAKPGLKQAALRITCRVALELDGLEKSSVQLADGEQSEALAALADALLDRVEPLAASGVSARSLEDGLRKLAAGRLAAEALHLRFVRLPADGEGEILTMRDGLESRRAYAPGRRIGEAEVSELGSERLAAVVKALLGADVASLPVNLWSADHVELEVGVLGHRTTVIGRDFSRLVEGEPDEARARFERLVAFLRRTG